MILDKHLDQQAVKIVLKTKIDEALDMVDSRHAFVIRRRYGLDGERWTLKQVAAWLGVTVDRIRQMEMKTLRMLRVPKRSKLLKCFVVNEVKYDLNGFMPRKYMWLKN